MKVLLISNYNVIEGRGPMFRLINMIPHLNKRCDVVLCSLNEMDSPAKNMAQNESISYYEIPYITKGWFVQNIDELVKNISLICKKENIDLIVLTWEIWDIAVALQRNINMFNCEFAVVMHSIPFVGSTIKTGNYIIDYIKKIIFEPRFMIKRYLLSRFLQVNRYMHEYNIITMTKTVEKKLNKYFNNIKLYTSYPGYAIDLSAINSVKNKKYIYDYVYMAKFEYGKGIFEVIHIMKELKELDNDFRFALVGDFTFKDEETKFLELLKSNNLESNIDILGWLNDDKKYAVILESKVFIYPSFAGDTFSICLLEALACGKQIVCYDVPFVKDNFNISSVHRIGVFDNKSFAQKAYEIVNAGDYYSQSSVKFVQQNYSSWKSVADAEFEVYRRIVGDNNE